MIPEWTGQVGGIIAAIVGLGAMAQFLRGSRDKGTITTLQQNNDALIERVGLLEDEAKRLKAEAEATSITHRAEVEAVNLRLKALEAEKGDLLRQRPSAEAIQSLRERLEMHDAATLAAIAELAGKREAP